MSLAGQAAQCAPCHFLLRTPTAQAGLGSQHLSQDSALGELHLLFSVCSWLQAPLSSFRQSSTLTTPRVALLVWIGVSSLFLAVITCDCTKHISLFRLWVILPFKALAQTYLLFPGPSKICFPSNSEFCISLGFSEHGHFLLKFPTPSLHQTNHSWRSENHFNEALFLNLLRDKTIRKVS